MKLGFVMVNLMYKYMESERYSRRAPTNERRISEAVAATTDLGRCLAAARDCSSPLLAPAASNGGGTEPTATSMKISDAPSVERRPQGEDQIELTRLVGQHATAARLRGQAGRKSGPCRRR